MFGTSCRETFGKGTFAWLCKRDEGRGISVGSSKPGVPVMRPNAAPWQSCCGRLLNGAGVRAGLRFSRMSQLQREAWVCGVCSEGRPCQHRGNSVFAEG